MLKKLIYAVISFNVVFLSHAALADITKADLPITEISLSADGQSIDVQGYFSTPCLTDARPELKISEKEERTLIFKMVATVTADLCIQVLGPSFAQSIDFRSLKYELERAGIEASGSYRLITLDGKLDVEVQIEEEILPLPAATTQVEGKVFKFEGSFAIYTKDSEILVIKHSSIDLSEFIGKEVVLLGHLFAHSAPGIRFTLHMPEQRFFVTGIIFTAKETSPKISWL
jgi:hypothetical protein